MSDSENAEKSGPISGVDYDPFATGSKVEIASTLAQREMWLSAQAGSGAVCAYNESFSVRLAGAVDDDSLLRGLQALADCHEALRGHFSEDGERFIIEPAMMVPVAQHDLSNLPPDERQASLKQLQTEDAKKPHDLSRGPLFRAAIIRLDVQERVVMFSANHAACDGWSLDVLLADLGRLYSAFAGGAPLPTPPRHGFSDYVSHCQTPEYAARVESSRAFWRKAFEVLPPPFALPHDGHRPAVRSYGARHSLHAIPLDLLTAVKKFSLAQGFSFFSVLLSAFAALLHRISQQDDLVIGIPVAGHPDAGMEDCVGHLVNLVPVRFRIEPGMSFLDLCRVTHTTVLDARENASVSFGELVADLKVPRDSSRVPLIAAVFTHVQKYAPGKLVFAGCSVEYSLNARCFETFEINLNAIESREGLQLQTHANSDLYTQGWLDWRLRELESVMRAGCAAPEASIETLALLPSDEAGLVTEVFNRTEGDYPRDLPLAQLVEAQVERTPGAVAVVCGSDSLSFAEVNARANQLAHELRARGAGPDRLVGICAERSVDMVVALLAVVKAGAAYLPLDPLLPQERLSYMLEDSGASLVVTEERVRASLPAFSGTVVSLDDQGWKSNPRDNLAVAVQPDNLAYVIYTSGSTGEPKGVEVPRGALTNLLWSMRDWLGLTTEDRLLAVTTISFDIAGVDMWLPLLVGARLVVASREEAVDGVRLREHIDRHEITFLQATPVTWRLLLEAGWKGKSDLQIVCTGEAMPRDLAAALAPMVRRLWNLYGPTETTIWSTGYLVRDGNQPVLIGRPVANTQCYILDKDRHPVPIGVVGELYIGGDGLARGYLRRPELTAEKFLPDPFRSQPGARMYRTGDLARYQADGNIECLGRTDHQVKIRGYRIELGEIEAAIARHLAVRQVVVVAREDAPGEKRLVAYLVAEDPPPDLVDQIRGLLRATLPEYMVPSHFVGLDAFPLTPSGKIDRKTLPPPSAQPTTAPSRGPRTTTEECLLGIWRNLLKRDGISTDDNFFDVGGNSLLGVALAFEVNKQMGVQLPLSQVLRSPTIVGLAEAVDVILARRQASATQDSSELIELRAGGPKCLFFAFDGLGEVLPYLNLARRMPPQYAVYGILPRRLPEIPLAHASIPDMAKHCVEQMRRRQAHGPYTIAGLCAGGVVAFAVAEQLEQDHQEIDQIILLDTISPIASLRRWRSSAKRWKRFSMVLRRAWQPQLGESPPSSLQTSAAHSPRSELFRKIRNVVTYEALRLAKSASVAARIQLLRKVLEESRPWPRWVPALSVADIYASARASYSPGCVRAPIVLVRAQEGVDDDEPAAQNVVDLLLGWEKRTTGPLEVIDAPGGHSSMLQEPNVAFIADRLVHLLESSGRTNVGPIKASERI
jgi:amino acid adenylation domain-containing protein